MKQFHPVELYGNSSKSLQKASYPLRLQTSLYGIHRYSLVYKIKTFNGINPQSCIEMIINCKFCFYFCHLFTQHRYSRMGSDETDLGDLQARHGRMQGAVREGYMYVHCTSKSEVGVNQVLACYLLLLKLKCWRMSGTRN